MRFFSWFTSKSQLSEGETNPLPNDHEITERLAIPIHSYCQEPGGLAQLLKPTCAVVLHTDGNVALHCPSGPAFIQGIVSFAFLHELPAFKNVMSTLSVLSKAEGSEILIKDWIKLSGPTEVDTTT